MNTPRFSPLLFDCQIAKLSEALCMIAERWLRAAFVLIDAEPLGIGHPVLREQSASS